MAGLHARPARMAARVWRRRFRLLAALFCLALVCPASQDAAHAAAGPTAVFDWSMPSRMTGRPLGGGTGDLASLAEAVFPGSWPVELNACGSTGGDSPIAQFDWQIRGPGIAEAASLTTASCSASFPFPEQGTYGVTLAVTNQQGTVANSSAQVAVRDLLIVTLGDSVASGEGNPDVPAFETPDGRPIWQDARCHRSGWAGPALAAMALENATPHTSVTFVSFACSGASIGAGLAGPYAGAEPAADGSLVPPQIEQLAGLYSEARRLGRAVRPVDALVLSIGANDIGFGSIVFSCLLQEQCYQHHADRDAGVEAWKLLTDGLQALGMEYGVLGSALDAELMPPVQRDRIFLLEYFDMTGNDDGSFCTSVLGGVTADEVVWAGGVALPLLNQVSSAAAVLGGANFVSGPAAAFRRHGYCAADHWVTRLEEALFFERDYRGTLHPNLQGQVTYAALLSQAIAQRLQLESPSAAMGAGAEAVHETYQRWERAGEAAGWQVPPPAASPGGR